MNLLNNVSPDELMVLVTAFALTLSKDKSTDELNDLGNIFVALGSLLLVNAAHSIDLSSLEKDKSNSNNDTSSSDSTDESSK
ncbi:MAG: hypothetical protein MR639_04840 [Clostridium sp.]|uniref:hypothetical protein n=1 Tax=Clostridium sp. TaxID=1506 RepID=UPI002A8F7315|nr:hypothetical protein [Clostridium sp.]MDY5097085.1 hypothetical protein [Clostridium sp.]